MLSSLGEEEKEYLNEDFKEDEKYSYNSLVSKKSHIVTSLNDITNSDLQIYKSDNDKFALLAMKTAKDKKHGKNTENQTYVHCDDTGTDIMLSKKSFKHGIARTDKAYYQVCLEISDIIRNSIALNELEARNDTNGSTVLLGMCENDTDYLYVRTVVSNKTHNIKDYDIVYAIKKSAIKKGDVSQKAPGLHQSDGSQTSPMISIADLLHNVKNVPLINEVFSQDVANNLGVTRSKGTLTNDLRYSRKRSYDPKNDKEPTFEEVKQLSQEDAQQGKGLVDFVNAVEQMTDKSLISKRKHRIGRISVGHAEFAQTLLEEIGIDIDLSNFELWIDGTGAQHIEIRHGIKGKADSTMVEDELKAKIPWAVNNADSGEIMRNDKGEIEYSNRFFNADGSKAPQIKLYKKIGENTLCVSECVADSKFRRIYITSSYIKKGSNGQLLNMEELSSPQPTPEASFDSNATDNIIHDNSEKYNSSDERKYKSRENEFDFEAVDGGVKVNFNDFNTEKSNKADVKESTAEAAERASKRITLGMSNAECVKILKQSEISAPVISATTDLNIDLEDLQKNRKSKVEKDLIKRLSELECFKNYKTTAVDIDFSFTSSSMRKSMNSQVSDYGGNLDDLSIAVLNLQELLDNAILLETHGDKAKKENSRLKQVYVLMSAYQRSGSIVPVQFEIKQNKDDDNRLYLTVALTKIETGVMGDTVLDEKGRTRLLPVSNISLSQLIEKINSNDANFFKYIPSEMLSKEQMASK